MALTANQKRVMADLDKTGRVFLASAHNAHEPNHASKRTLVVMIGKGLVEWAEEAGWPYVVKRGTNDLAAKRAAKTAEQHERARRARAEELVQDPVARAQAILALEEKLGLFDPNTYVIPRWYDDEH